MISGLIFITSTEDKGRGAIVDDVDGTTEHVNDASGYLSLPGIYAMSMHFILKYMLQRCKVTLIASMDRKTYTPAVCSFIAEQNE